MILDKAASGAKNYSALLQDGSYLDNIQEAVEAAIYDQKKNSVGTNSSALASKADTSSIYTQQHINDNFQTVAPSGKSYAFDTDLVNFITASDITGKQDVAPSGETYAYVSQLPDTSSFITASASALTNYDKSSTVDTKIANSSGSTDLSNYYTISQTDSEG